jgi:cytochrome c556
MRTTKRQIQGGLRVAALLCLLLLIGGCGRQNLKEPFDKFQKNTAKTASIIGYYYAEINKYERDFYFRKLLFNPSEEMNLTYAGWNPTSFSAGPFDPKSIQARLDLIREIASYAELLSTLAGNDAPEQFETNAKALAEKFKELHKTFEELHKDPKKTDATAKDYIGPISNLSVIIGEMCITELREKELKKAICGAEEPMKQLLGSLKQDLKTYIEETHKQKEDAWLGKLASSYNNTPISERADMKPELRKNILADISRQVDIVEATALFKPSKAVSKMRVAHEMLARWAKGKIPLSSELVRVSLENYETEVKKLDDSFLKLQNLRKDNK